MGWYGLVGVTAAAVALAAGCTDRASEPGTGTATVVEVVDGDTLVLDFGSRVETVRLIGVDTPETRHPRRPVECFGPEASAFTARLLPVGADVRVERDIENRDDYGRLLAYVHRADDGLFVNAELARSGHAVPLSIEPNVTHRSTFVDAAREAEAADLGLWAACAG